MKSKKNWILTDLNLEKIFSLRIVGDFFVGNFFVGNFFVENFFVENFFVENFFPEIFFQKFFVEKIFLWKFFYSQIFLKVCVFCLRKKIFSNRKIDAKFLLLYNLRELFQKKFITEEKNVGY